MKNLMKYQWKYIGLLSFSILASVHFINCDGAKGISSQQGLGVSGSGDQNNDKIKGGPAPIGPGPVSKTLFQNVKATVSFDDATTGSMPSLLKTGTIFGALVDETTGNIVQYTKQMHLEELDNPHYGYPNSSAFVMSWLFLPANHGYKFYAYADNNGNGQCDSGEASEFSIPAIADVGVPPDAPDSVKIIPVTTNIDIVQQTTANADCSVFNNNPVKAGIYHVALHSNPYLASTNPSTTAQLFQITGNLTAGSLCSSPVLTSPLVPGQVIIGNANVVGQTITFEIPQSQIYLLNFNPSGCNAGDLNCEMQFSLYSIVTNEFYGMLPLNGDLDLDAANAGLLSQGVFRSVEY